MLESILHFLDINTVMFTLRGPAINFLGVAIPSWIYPMSYIEFFGTIFTGWCVWLAGKNKTITWFIGTLGILLYGYLYYQIQLYSDLIEQVYYLISGFLGWVLWAKPKTKISRNSPKLNIALVLGIIVATFGMTYVMSHIHIWLPNVFPVEASFPFLDAFTTVMSFVANILLAYKKIENWYLWIIVDVIGVWLYFVKGVPFISLLYLLFLTNAIYAYIQWRNGKVEYVPKTV